MHTLVAYSEDQDAGGVEVNIAAVADQHIKSAGDEVTVGNMNNIIGAMALIGSTGTRAKLVAPSLRRVNPYQITPTVLALFASGSENYGMHPESPIPLEINESLEAMQTSNPAAAEQGSVVVFLASGAVAPVSGRIHHVRFTATLALLAGAWAFAGLTFTDDLPVNNYDVVGCDIVAATGVAFRLVPVGASHRPGGPVRQAIGNPMDKVFRNGGLGVWCTFNTVQLPSIEILSSAAAGSATYTGTMDLLVK